jgi:hypothetical protein
MSRQESPPFPRRSGQSISLNLIIDLLAGKNEPKAFLFYESFHGDNGAGLGASHQTGWTGLVAKAIELYGYRDPQKRLEAGKGSAFLTEEAAESRR